MGKEVDNLLLFKGVAQNGSGNILPPHMDGGVFLFRLYFVEILREDSIELVLQFLQRVRILIILTGPVGINSSVIIKKSISGKEKVIWIMSGRL